MDMQIETAADAANGCNAREGCSLTPTQAPCAAARDPDVSVDAGTAARSSDGPFSVLICSVRSSILRGHGCSLDAPSITSRRCLQGLASLQMVKPRPEETNRI